MKIGNKNWKSVRLALTCIAIASLAACETSDPAVPGLSGNGPTISGSVIKGPVTGSTVTAYLLNADGTRGAVLGTGTSGAGGAFSFALTSVPSGPIEVVAAGGTYVSEADGSTVTKASDLRALVTGVGATGVSGLVLTPLTDLVAARVKALVSGGSTPAAALLDAEKLVTDTYGLTGESLETLVPLFDKASVGKPGFLLGLVLGALDTCDKALPAGLRGALFTALSDDLSDGVFDGKKGATPIVFSTGSALAGTAGTTDFLTCVSGYVAGGNAITSAGIVPADLTAVTAKVRTAVTNSPATPKATGLAAGSSGAITTLAYGGKQWLFIAARSQGVVAIDITDPTAAAPTVKVFSGLVATNFGGQEIGGVVPLLGAAHPQLLVYAYSSKHIALINADTGVVDYEADLPLLATSPVSFSGGSAYIAGAIPDTGRDGVWLATADGYIFFDRVTQALGAKFVIDTPAKLAENLGGDVGNGYLFGPNYEIGIQLADLTSGKSYYMDSTAFRANFPSIREPDGGAVDAGYQVGIVTDEDSSQVGFINMKTIVKTDVTTGRNTFAPATGGFVPMNLGGATLSGSAVDSDTHQVLFMAGYSSDIVVGQMQDPLLGGASWTGLTDWRTQRNLTGYAYARDPHAVAVIRNLGNGKSYGYLLDGGVHKSFQVDMGGVLAAPSDGAAGRNLTSDPTTGTTPLVKSITW